MMMKAELKTAIMSCFLLHVVIVILYASSCAPSMTRTQSECCVSWLIDWYRVIGDVHSNWSTVQIQIQ